MSRLTDKRALITGASSGLGAAAAEIFAGAGATVHMLVRDEDKGRRVAERIAAATGAAAPVVEVCDVSSLASVGVPTYLVKYGDDISRALASHAATPSKAVPV